MAILLCRAQFEKIPTQSSIENVNLALQRVFMASSLMDTVSFTVKSLTFLFDENHQPSFYIWTDASNHFKITNALKSTIKGGSKLD